MFSDRRRVHDTPTASANGPQSSRARTTPMPMLCDIGAGLPLIDSSLQGEVAPSVAPGSTRSHSRHELYVSAPFRLDLTVSALRRLSTNIVDVLTSDGQYI